MPEEQTSASAAARNCTSQSPGPAAAADMVSGEKAGEKLFSSDEFRMFAYKILPCPKKTQHEWSTCPYSHRNEKARRRDPRIYNYLAIPCEATKQGGTCPRGDDCPNCHSLFEYWLHPSRYRTQLCRDMENGHCKRSVCFFAHSIEELRVPDHSHLNIPPEMQAAAAARSGSPASTDPDAASSSNSSGSSTPRASSKDGDSSSSGGSTNGKAATKPPQHSSAGSRAVNICHGSNAAANTGGRGYKYGNSNSPTNNSYSSSQGMYGPSLTSAACLEHQRAVLQLQQSQMQAQVQAQAHGLSPAGSMYEHQLQQMLLAAEAAQQAQQMQAAQMLAFQQSQAAVAWSAQLARSSMGSVRGGSPPVSPMPSGLMGGAASYGAEQRVFMPPSANSSTSMSPMAAVTGGWQSASLMRSLSTPVSNGLGSGLVRHSSGFPSCGSAVQLHNSGGSSVHDQQEMTLASLLSGANSVDSWASWSNAVSAGMGCGGVPTSLGLPMGPYSGQGQQQGAAGMGGLLDAGASYDTASLLMQMQHQQQQQQQQKAAASFLQSMGAGGQLGDCNNQAMADVLGMVMQQLMLQQG